MPHDPKHIITDLEDMLAGIDAHIKTLLAGVIDSANIGLAFKDERVDANETPEFPKATLYLSGIAPGVERRTGGAYKIVTQPSPSAPAATVAMKPTAVDVSFQLDTYAETFEEDWAIQLKLLPYLGGEFPQKVTTTAGREFFLTFTTWDTLDEITADNWFRKAWRFKCEVWFADPTTPLDAYVVLQRKLTMTGAETWKMDPDP